MTRSLFSPLWYRIAERTPRIRPDVSVRRQVSRGVAWHVLVNAVTGRQCRINERAFQLVGRLDGRYSVQAIWDRLLEQLRDDAPTQDEVVQLLGQLGDQGFVDMGAVPDFPNQAQRRDQRRRRRRRSFVNPFAFRIPLGDPTPLLDRLSGFTQRIFRPWVLLLWLCTLSAAAVAAALNWQALSHQAGTYLATPYFLLLAWIVFPLIKSLHELAHGLAVRHYGGNVHEAGITLFVLTPAPYVDASSSAGFVSRYQRGVVSAAGMAVELGLAALGLLLWVSIQPGLLRDLAFVTVIVAGVSTLLFNANPLLRFDGYYILIDLFDLPNLATRSKRYWQERLRAVVGPALSGAAVVPAPGERKWLLAYAPSAWCCRIAISILIVVGVGQFSVVLGIVAAAYAVVTVVIVPIISSMRDLLLLTAGTREHWRTRLGISATAVGLLVLVLAVPIPFHTSAWGVVWLPEQAHVRAQTDGFVTDFAVDDGQLVVPGQLLLTMEDPDLLAQRELLALRLDELRADRFDNLLRDTLRASNLREALERAEAELARIEERIEQLRVRSQVAGRVVLPRQQDVLGTFARRGAALGYVLDRREIIVRAAVPQRDAALIRERHRASEVRLAESLSSIFSAALVRDIPAAVYELPSAALGDRGGGPYQTDPADPHGVRTSEPVVHIDLALSERALERVGGRVWVRFDHGAAPLAQQSYRRTRQLFLQHFNPVG